MTLGQETRWPPTGLNRAGRQGDKMKIKSSEIRCDVTAQFGYVMLDIIRTEL